jgi:hypothetical protein
MAQKLTSFNFCDKLEGSVRTRAKSILRSAVLLRDEVISFFSGRRSKRGDAILNSCCSP